MSARKQLVLLAAGILLLTRSAVAQDADAMSRWGQRLGDALVKFLPNAAESGMTVDSSPIFSAFANETYVYKGADSMVSKYPSYIVHQTWWFNDAELTREMADLEKEKASLNQEMEKTLAEYLSLHGAELKSFEKAHLAEMESLSKQVADLTQQGKSQEARALVDKLEKLPAVYPPYAALTESFKKRQDELTDRERILANRRRQVSFQIHTNRTPTTTALRFAPKPSGTLAGHPLYRQEEANHKVGDWDASFIYWAVYLGPSAYQNPKIKIGHKELSVKTIVVWAWIETHPATAKADEAAARKVLESMDYNGLAKLIEP